MSGARGRERGEGDRDSPSPFHQWPERTGPSHLRPLEPVLELTVHCSQHLLGLTGTASMPISPHLTTTPCLSSHFFAAHHHSHCTSPHPNTSLSFVTTHSPVSFSVRMPRQSPRPFAPPLSLPLSPSRLSLTLPFTMSLSLLSSITASLPPPR